MPSAERPARRVDDIALTQVMFQRRDGAVTMPHILGPDPATIGLGDVQIHIPAGQTKMIQWPDQLDHWTHNGQPHATPQFWRPA